MSAHSPLPWRAYPVGTTVPWYDVCEGIVSDKVTERTASQGLSPEDAAFIVRACNNHEALVEAANDFYAAVTENIPGAAQSVPARRLLRALADAEAP